ncbi:Uncharacterised protein [uncultured Prevotella sp.]|uniref:hypothetical protein n=1 Tax=uncultured Prevotella sp. TaxID=159272 RepID=UPI001A364787|nr:hypothetical protein [uncultured Prevotella sp.]VTY05342.1 Uncharacterised protein [uncultured Prevotella sp.]
MKKLFLSLLAVGFLAIAPATSLASNSNIVATNCPNGGKKVDAKAFTNKLVKELKLNKKQAAELLKLNNEYADILVCPKQKTDCKRAESCCKKNEASHCDKQTKSECKGEAGSCCKQAKPECKSEAAQCNKQAQNECKGEAGSCCKQAKPECKSEAAQCNKQAQTECKGEAGNCCKQAKPECKSEANHCDKQAKAECPKRMCEMKTKRNAYLEGLKKILTDKQYQQFMKM